MKRIVIVGAGISGLTLAHVLRTRGGNSVEVALLEGSSRAGGVVQSERVEGYLCEHGPNGFLDRAPATLSLIEDLGLRDRLLPSDDRARRRFIYSGGRLREVPTGPLGFITTDVLSARGRFRVTLEPFLRGASRADESIHQFARRRLGAEAADVLVDAATTGIFGGSSHELSIRACFPRLWQMEHDHGSIVRAMLRRRRRSTPAPPGGSGFGRLVSFTDGIETLTNALATSAGESLNLNARVIDVDRMDADSGTRWHVRLADGTSVSCEHLVIATAAGAAGRILAARDPELAMLLDGIRVAPIAVVCLGFGGTAPDARIDGFGFLVPGQEQAGILGAVWDSSIFSHRAPAGHTLIRVLVGGGRDPRAVSLDDDQLVSRVLSVLRMVLGTKTSPTFVRVIRQIPGLPQYVVGHVDRLARIDTCLQRHDSLRLIGNSYRGVALNACIDNATSLAMELLFPKCGAGAVPAYAKGFGEVSP